MPQHQAAEDNDKNKSSLGQYNINIVVGGYYSS